MKIMKNILIVSGGALNTDWAKEWLGHNEFDFVIAADRGLGYAELLDIKVDFLLGDYDSVDEDVLNKYKYNTDMVTYPKEKDYTDTHIALKKALELNPQSISIIGAAGTRLDHTMTNIFIMYEALRMGVSCSIYDKYNKIYLIGAGDDKIISKNNQYGQFLSFLPATEQVVFSVKGVKYPLDNYTLKQGLSLCQSNEISKDYAEVKVKEGILVAFESKD